MEVQESCYARMRRSTPLALGGHLQVLASDFITHQSFGEKAFFLRLNKQRDCSRKVANLRSKQVNILYMALAVCTWHPMVHA